MSTVPKIRVDGVQKSFGKKRVLKGVTFEVPAGESLAIAAGPEILFFDEPTTGLDPIVADVINDLIASSVKRLGATAISITHDMASARKIATRIAMLHQGRIIWSGPAADIDHSGNE